MLYTQNLKLPLYGISEQQAGDARRIAELEFKKKKTQEKISSEEHDQATAEAKKIQQESMSRMSKHNLPIGLPKTLTLRDDPLTKAQAFLTELPTIE